MQIKSVNSEIIKILFDTTKEQLLLGETIKIRDKNNNAVLSQVFKIENSSENFTDNIACTKILFTIKHNELTNWNGSIPSKGFVVEKISNKELLRYLKCLNNNNPVLLGTLCTYSTSLSIEASLFESPTIIYCDKQSQRINISHLLADQLKENGAKVVLLDFRGEYSYISSAVRIKAGKDFKLPLNSRGIESLYDKVLTGASIETRAVIEDIFMQVQDYADSSEHIFVPFTGFKDVVEDEYRQNKISELVLLKNKLTKIDKQGIFASNKSEILYLKESLENNNLVIVDFSDISPVWHKEFVNFIVNSNINKFKKRFFLIFEARSNNLDDDLIDKIYIQGYRSGIKPIISLGYESKFAKNLLSIAKNHILFSPKTSTNIFPDLENYLSKLNPFEALIYGKFSNHIPLFIQINDVLQNETEGNTGIFEDSHKIEVMENIDYDSLEEVYKYYDDVDNPLNQPPEPIEKFPEEDEALENINDEFHINYSDQNLEEIEEYQKYSYEDSHEEINEKSYDDDIESLYRGKSETQDHNYPGSDDEKDSLEIPITNIPIYSTAGEVNPHADKLDLKEGNTVKHQKYGIGIIERIIRTPERNLCSIRFEKVGKRLLDPALAGLQKIK